MSKTTVSYKGFDKNLQCRGFQYAIGQTFNFPGKVKVCSNGAHACEHPLNCFDYYAPALSRYCEVTQSGDMDRDGSDTKIASATITIGVELSIGDMVARAVKWVFDRAKPEEGSSATGTWGAASATGTWGAALATGYRGAASATGPKSVALASGYEGRTLAVEGSAFCLVNRDEDMNIVAIRASKVGENGIEAGRWYMLSAEGLFQECEAP